MYDSDHGLIDHCTAYNLAGDGCELEASNSVVQYCLIYDSTANRSMNVDGIVIGGSNNTIQYNTVHDLQNTAAHADLIVLEPRSNASNPTINTVIEQCTYNGLQYIFVDSYYYGAGSTGIVNTWII